MQLLSFEQLAGVLGTDGWTLLRMLNHGQVPLPTVRIGDLLRWDAEVLAPWKSRGCPAAIPPSDDEFDRIRRVIFPSLQEQYDAAEPERKRWRAMFSPKAKE